MDRLTEAEFLLRILRMHPGQAYVLEDGTALAALADPSKDVVLIIDAPDGGNFNEMTEEEINRYIVVSLTAINN